MVPVGSGRRRGPAAGRLGRARRPAAATAPPARRAASHSLVSRRRPAARPAADACSGCLHSCYNNSAPPRPRPRPSPMLLRRAPRSRHPRPRATIVVVGELLQPHSFLLRRAPTGAGRCAFALLRMRGARGVASLRGGSDAMEARLRCRRWRRGAAIFAGHEPRYSY